MSSVHTPAPLPPLREVIRVHELRAKKALGQNFLLDLNLTDRIAGSAPQLRETQVLEIGPGPGGLTRSLLAAGAPRVVAVERDARCLEALAAVNDHYGGRLRVVHGNALELDLAALVQGPAQVVANLPYNIATPLLIGFLQAEPWPPWWRALTLMFQKEVAQRIVAAPSTDHYGRLSVLAGWRTRARILFDIPARAFTPPPKVTSSVVQLLPRTAPPRCDRAGLERVTQAAFGQRRKMLRSALRQLTGDPEALLADAEIDPQARAETVPIDGFVRLANALAERPR